MSIPKGFRLPTVFKTGLAAGLDYQALATAVGFEPNTRVTSSNCLANSPLYRLSMLSLLNIKLTKPVQSQFYILFCYLYLTEYVFVTGLLIQSPAGLTVSAVPFTATPHATIIKSNLERRFKQKNALPINSYKQKWCCHKRKRTTCALYQIKYIRGKFHLYRISSTL